MTQHISSEVAASEVRNNCHPQWWRDPGLRALNIRLVGLMISSMAFGFDAALIGGLLANQRWFSDLKIFDATLVGVVIASNSMGAAIGIAPAPFLSDRIGRRPTCVVFCVCMIACSIGQAFTRTSSQFLGVRLCLGLFSVSLNISSNLLVAEISHPRQRAQVTSLWITFFYVGAITVAWTAYGALDIHSSWTWRLPVIIQAAWNAIQLPLLIFLCPESPRWLALKGRGEEAKALLARFHANGDLHDELVELEYEEIMATTTNEQQRKHNSWYALVSSKPNIHRLLLAIFLGLASQWVGNAVVNFYLAPVLASVGVTSNRSQNAINGGLQIFSWVISIAGALCSEKLGRKTLLIASACGMLVAMSLVTACSAVYSKSGSLGAGRAVIAFLFLFFGCYCIGFTPIPPLYVAEISTPATRSNIVSVYWMCTGLALCFNQFVNPIALAAIGWKYYLVYVAILVMVIGLFYFFLPETKGLTMEEVAGIFDSNVANINAQAAETVRQKHASELDGLQQDKDGKWVQIEQVKSPA
jgi:sugar porter (SP) family MFS transporter